MYHTIPGFRLLPSAERLPMVHFPVLNTQPVCAIYGTPDLPTNIAPY